MKTLLIFDQNIDIKRLKKEVTSLKTSHIILFPLTSRWNIIRDLEETYPSGGCMKVELLDSARFIDKEVDEVRQRVSKWAADLGEYRIGNRSIKQWFMLPKRQVSTWWFSLFSEKNTLKTDVFFRIAQVNAIDKILTSHSFNSCVYSLSDASFLSAVKMLTKRHDIASFGIRSLYLKQIPFKERIRCWFSRTGIFYDVFRALRFLGIFTSRAVRSKFIMGPVKKRIKPSGDSMLFVSYFPAVDKEAARKGVLRNKYAIPLQEKLKRMGKKIIWIWMYTFMDGHSYEDALRLTRRFAQNGETNYLLHEFLSVRILVRTVLLWLRQIAVFFRLKGSMSKEVLCGDLSVPEGNIFIKDIMITSFVGRTGLEGILNFELYKEVFSFFSYASHCIYYLEMQGWEKALNAAKVLQTPSVKSIGFQHSSLSQNHFVYFHHPNEMPKRRQATSLPLPDILACNGDIPLSLMARSGYPNMRKAEAVRHMYLNDYPKTLHPDNKDNIVFVACSISPCETKALISLIHDAFPKAEGFEIWLKGHPSLPFEDFFGELDINIRDSGYLIKRGPIDELLRQAKILIAGNSAVTVEGVAAGCRVIIPVFSDTMVMNNLKGFERFYRIAYNPGQLKEIVEKDIISGIPDIDVAENSDFISKYWCLDRSLRRWEEVLR